MRLHCRQPRPYHKQFAKNIGLDCDSIGHAIYLRNDRIMRHHCRVNALLDARFGALRHTEKLDAVTRSAAA